MTHERLDTTYLVETPEGIDLHAELAGPISRALAYTIDIALRSVALTLVSSLLGLAGKAGVGLILVLSFLAEWFYPVFFEVLRNGQTPGKKAMGLAVVNDDLTPISWGTSIVRNLLRAADFLPFAYLGGLVSMALSGRFQRLGDIAAGTLVIHRQNNRASTRLPDETPLVPPFHLTLEDQRAIINFTQRHDSLSKDRQKELAGILLGNVPASADNGVRTVRGWGAWLLGAR